MEKRRTCPRCGSKRVAEILYGMPLWSPELEAMVDAGEIVPGGCEVMVDAPMPAYQCLDCGAELLQHEVR